MAKVTVKGFECEVKDDALDDMRLIDLMADAMDNPIYFPKLIGKLLGQEQKEALYKHLESESGRVPVKDVMEVVQTIFEALGDTGKN